MEAGTQTGLARVRVINIGEQYLRAGSPRDAYVRGGGPFVVVVVVVVVLVVAFHF